VIDSTACRAEIPSHAGPPFPGWSRGELELRQLSGDVSRQELVDAIDRMVGDALEDVRR